MRFAVTCCALLLTGAAGHAQDGARVQAARDACWREQGYASTPANPRLRPGLGDEIAACVRRRMSGGQPAAAPRGR